MPDNDYLIPDAPQFSEGEINRCRQTGDYMPLVFEWYRFVAELATIIAHVMPNSPAFRNVPAQHYHVLMGLLNRCARLMLSNIALSHQGKFGETTAIVDRCIFESSIKIIWLCFQASQEKFNSYIASGLKTELEFKSHILSQISERNGIRIPIEDRMLRSIENHISASGISETDIGQARPMPNLASLLEGLGHDRLFYIVAQKLGSHHIHGTWPSLIFHYLEKEDNGTDYQFSPRGHNCSTHINQFLFNAILMTRAMQGYTKYVLDDENHRAFWKLLESSHNDLTELLKITDDYSFS